MDAVIGRAVVVSAVELVPLMCQYQEMDGHVLLATRLALLSFLHGRA